jgi:hypothetical protein
MDRDALIADFVREWGYPDPVVNEDFKSELEKLISKICRQPSSVTKPFKVPLPDLKPKRQIDVDD